jgi:hypothetical protein
MSNTRKVSKPKPKPTSSPDVVDVDAMIAESTTEMEQVVLRFRGREWTFKGMSEAPINLFDEGLDEAHSALYFLQTMLADGEVLPGDVTLREATTLVNAYTKAATAGLSTGE